MNTIGIWKKKRLFECESSNSENSITRRNFVHRSENQELKRNLLCFHPIPKTAFLLFYSTFQSIKSCDLNPLKPHSKNLKFDIFGWPGIF